MTTQTSIQPFHVIPGAVVKDILNGLRQEAIEIVAQTYLTHERGETVNPDSYFLRFPAEPANRIIALPAAIVDSEGDQSVSGIKWLASYPDNIKIGRMIHNIAVKDGSAVAIPSFFGEERRW
ncbi:hypothetical protein MO767_13870 [Pseudomonas sp. UYIF39]|uniref:hypothetical protein n=1 Tax=Pseudomonas sp. UYIF39 TaxID=1630747 RepID=UPI00249DD370|nr:hypothetical protein [Pseudomonas sp. UYIF39]MDI3355431.1 hypothetical protein [Pseudomonas sp. UYIF39]